jgi:protein TonB
MGRVHDLKIETSSGSRLLDRAAVIAVQKWIFEPGQQGEEKLDMWVKVPVTFQLK